MRKLEWVQFLIGMTSLWANMPHVHAAESSIEPGKAEEKVPTVGKKAEKKTVKEQDGETYNFYFQKAPGASKVKQGETQTVTPEAIAPGEERPDKVSRKSDERDSSADLLAGLAVMPGKSALGLSIGAHVFSSSKLGFRLGFFSASGRSSGNSNSSFSAFGIDETSNKNAVYGGDLALSYDLVRTRSGRVSPLLGVLMVLDKNTKETHTFDAFGSNDSSSSTSTFKVGPCIGMNGTVYFSNRFGANLTFEIPFEPKYSTLSLQFVFSI